MNEIKRWTLKQTGATLLGDKAGEWVSYADHIVALSQRPADPAWISDGAGLITAERLRQVDVEGWTPEHDDEHSKGELARAGACYIRCAHNQTAGVSRQMEVPLDWPWESYWWKPSRLPERNFVKGCALIAAEIDRLQRLASPVPKEKE